MWIFTIWQNSPITLSSYAACSNHPPQVSLKVFFTENKIFCKHGKWNPPPHYSFNVHTGWSWKTIFQELLNIIFTDKLENKISLHTFAIAWLPPLGNSSSVGFCIFSWNWKEAKTSSHSTYHSIQDLISPVHEPYRTSSSRCFNYSKSLLLLNYPRQFWIPPPKERSNSFIIILTWAVDTCVFPL